MEKHKKTIGAHSITYVRMLVFLVSGIAAFYVGVRSSEDITPVSTTEAQVSAVTNLNVILQYQPVSGGEPKPIVLEEFNADRARMTPMFVLQDIRSGEVIPSDPRERCRFTSPAGRCAVRGIPVGSDPSEGGQIDRQYDIIVDTDYIEYVTNIRLETSPVYVRFDRSECNDGISFNVVSGGNWCISRQGGSFAQEYDVTITLAERDDCTGTNQPTPVCSSDTEISTFECNGVWEPAVAACGPVQCPDGNYAQGSCENIVEGLSSCSRASACANNRLCTVQNFGATTSYAAGLDAIEINGRRFGDMGGSVIFQTADGHGEVVDVPPGPDWTDSRIRVHVPLSAISGVLKIHPNTHGFVEDNSGPAPLTVPVACDSPVANVRAFTDQFAILSATPMVQSGVLLTSAGFSTRFNILVHHNAGVFNLQDVTIELLDGAFPDPDNLPDNRIVIAEKTCAISGSADTEDIISCSIPIPPQAANYDGPFTFLFTISDGSGNTARYAVLDGGTSALIGDFNIDGRIDISDAVYAMRLSDGRMPVKSEHILRDTNGDNRVTFADVLFVIHSITR